MLHECAIAFDYFSHNYYSLSELRSKGMGVASFLRALRRDNANAASEAPAASNNGNGDIVNADGSK